jgi:hypothetical protein
MARQNKLFDELNALKDDLQFLNDNRTRRSNINNNVKINKI